MVSSAVLLAERESPPPAASPVEPPLDRRLLVGFMAMVLGMFMAILDIQIVASSIGEIQAGLSASADEISWVQTAYLIAEVIMIPLSGFLSHMMSTRILFVVSAIGFTIMSIGCAFATSIESMVIFRVLQGFIGGAMIPTVYATVYLAFPGRRQVSAMLITSLVVTMAPTLGPTIGGYLTQTLSWHWLFLINIGPGMLVAAGVWFLIDVDRPDWRLITHFDYLGLLAMALCLGSLEYVLEEGPSKEWFADSTMLRLAWLAALSGIAFIWRALTYHQPVVALTPFKNRNFLIGSLLAAMNGIGLYGVIYLLPVFLGQVRHYNSLQIGRTLLVTGVFQLVAALSVSGLISRIGARPILTVGLCLFGMSMYLMTGVTSQWDYGELFLPQILRGIGIMCLLIPTNALALGTLPLEEVKNAAGMFNLMRNLGGALGLASLNTLLIERTALHRQMIGETINAAHPIVLSTLDGLSARYDSVIAGDPDLAALKTLAGMVTREATAMTFSDCFMIIAVIHGISLLAVPFLKIPKKGVAAAPRARSLTSCSSQPRSQSSIRRRAIESFRGSRKAPSSS